MDPEAFAVCALAATVGRMRSNGVSIQIVLRELDASKLGTPACPSLGSLGHSSGLCLRPCAYVAKGCKNGVECTYCHLCDTKSKRQRPLQNSRSSESSTAVPSTKPPSANETTGFEE